MDELDNDKFDQMDERFETESFEYTMPSSLKIPEKVKEKYLADGYKLKWIRYRTPSGIDTSNLRRRMHPSEGFVFVRPNEFQAEELIQIGDAETYGDDQIVTTGDLVLMKTRTEKAEARKRYFEGTTQAQADAIQQRIDSSNLSNSSRSVVRTGKQAHFRGNV